MISNILSTIMAMATARGKTDESESSMFVVSQRKTTAMKMNRQAMTMLDVSRCSTSFELFDMRDLPFCSLES